MNRLLMGSKTIYNLLYVVTFKDVEVIIISIRRCNFRFPCKSHASEQKHVTFEYFSVSS